MQEGGPSIFFSLLVITISFLPVFTLEATEGRLFKPLAFTKTYSIGFAAIFAVTLTPALAVLLIRGKVHDEARNPLNRWLAGAYPPVGRFVVDPRREVLVLAPLAIVLNRAARAASQSWATIWTRSRTPPSPSSARSPRSRAPAPPSRSGGPVASTSTSRSSARKQPATVLPSWTSTWWSRKPLAARTSRRP